MNNDSEKSSKSIGVIFEELEKWFPNRYVNGEPMAFSYDEIRARIYQARTALKAHLEQRARELKELKSIDCNCSLYPSCKHTKAEGALSEVRKMLEGM